MSQKPAVTEKERKCINEGIRKLRQDGKFGGPDTQLNRVIIVASGADWFSLPELERLIAYNWPNEGDIQSSISARLRDISPIMHGLVKQTRAVRNEATGKTTWFYRLVPSHTEVRL